MTLLMVSLKKGEVEMDDLNSKTKDKNVDIFVLAMISLCVAISSDLINKWFIDQSLLIATILKVIALLLTLVSLVLLVVFYLRKNKKK